MNNNQQGFPNTFHSTELYAPSPKRRCVYVFHRLIFKDKNGEAETQALFYGVPWSEGSLGILVAATLRIISVKPFVKLTYTPVHSAEVC